MLTIERTFRDEKNGVVITTPEGKTLICHVIWISRNRCKIRFSDQKEVEVLREELYLKIKKEKNLLDDKLIGG